MAIPAKIGVCTLLLALATCSAQSQDPVYSTHMEVVRGKPYVMVMVNDRGPFRFLVDTGTGGQAIVTMELADQLQLPLIGDTRITDPSRQGEKRADTVFIDKLSIGGADFIGVEAVRHKLYGDDGECQGVLGFKLFEDYLLTLDYPNQRLTLASGALVPDEENTVLPFHMPDGVPVARLRIGDLQVDALFDSGGTGLSIPEQIASQLKFSSEPVDFGNGESLSSRFLIKAGILGSDVQVGQYTFTQPFVEVNSAFPQVNFGSCPMQNFSFTFDQANLLMRLEASQRVLHLAATPTRPRLQNAPQLKPTAPELVPIG
jgi:predicted aspartyl protease